MVAPETEIIVTVENRELARLVVTPGDYVIGQGAEAQVRVEAGQVEPRHARLTVNYDHALIEDLGSSRGTFVNGRQITEPTRLWPGQKIQVGAATVELRRRRPAAPDETLTPLEAALARLLPADLRRERRYEVGAPVARGGMGAILEAREAAIERRVAMKVMLDGMSADDLGRFVAEAKITGQLEHPNIVPVHELGVDENEQAFYTMKLVRGITLRKVFDQLVVGLPETLAKYPLATRLTIFQKACDAVAFAHARGVIHRDLKPENIMLGDFGEVLVMDWGLAKVVGNPADFPPPVPDEAAARSAIRMGGGAGGSTSVGTVLGTAQYMSPEQARGEVETLDPRTDIYALGAILFHLLELRPSVTGANPDEILEKVRCGEIEWAPANDRALRPRAAADRPASLLAVVRKAMALRKEERYASVVELQAEIAAYQAGFATAAEQAGPWKQFTLFVRRNKAVAATAAAALLLLAVLGGIYTLSVTRERDRAEAQRARAEAGETRAGQALAEVNAHLLRAKLDHARSAFDSGRAEDGLAWLAAALRQEPAHPTAPRWLLSALTEHSFSLPSAPDLVLSTKREDRPPFIRFDPEGKRLLVCGSDPDRFGVVDAVSGRLLWPQWEMGELEHAEFSPDGQSLFTRSYPAAAVSRRDLATGAVLARTPASLKRSISALALSRDGALLATGDIGGVVRLWNAQTLEPAGEPWKFADAVWQLGFSADGRWLAARIHRTLHLCDVRAGAAVAPRQLQTHVSTFAFHPAQAVLLTGSNNAQLPRRFDLATGKAENALAPGLVSNLAVILFSPDGSRFAGGGQDDRVWLWDTRTLALQREFDHPADVKALAFSAEGLRLFSVAGDRRFRAWHTTTGALLAESPQQDAGPFPLITSTADGSRLALAHARHTVTFWDRRAGDQLPLHLAYAWSNDGLHFSADGRLLWSRRGRSAYRFDLSNGGSALPEIKLPPNIFKWAFSEDRQWLAFGDARRAHLWNAATSEPAGAPMPHGQSVTGVAFSPDGRLLATTSADAKARVWDLATRRALGEPIALSTDWASVMAFSPDGGQLAIGGWQGALIDVREQEVRARLVARDQVTTLRFSPDGRQLAVGTALHGTLLLDPATGVPRQPALPHGSAVSSVSFSPDGRRLLTSSADRTARVWDVHAGHPLTPPLAHPAAVRDAAFSPDGAAIATAAGAEARLWDAATGAPLSEPLRAVGEVGELAFSPDAQRLVLAAPEAVTIHDLPPALPPGAPAWLPALAEAVAQRRLDARGEMVAVEGETFWNLREQFQRRSGDAFERWAAWFFADRATRTAGPWNERPLAAELARVASAGSTPLSRETLRYDPENLSALSMVARDLELRARKDPSLESDAEFAAAAVQRASLRTQLAIGALPPRDPACSPRELDLSRHYTHLLATPLYHPATDSLAELPPGLQTLAGVRWDVRGFVPLHGQKAPRSFPWRSEGIPVGQRLTRLHVLHACGYVAQNGATIGSYVLRFVDGETHTLPIVYGEDVRDWKRSDDPAETTRADEAWRAGSVPTEVRLFHRAYDNPRPEVEVATLDVVSTRADAAPFVVALTVE